MSTVRIALALAIWVMVFGGCQPGETATRGSASREPVARQPVGEIDNPGVAPPAPSPADSAEDLATVDGLSITMADVREQAGDELSRIELQYLEDRHRLVEETLEALIRDRLLEMEAAGRGTTRQELIDALVSERVEVTDDEVDSFLRQTPQGRSGGNLEALEPQARELLRQREEQQALERFTDELAREREIEYLLEPFRVEVEPGDAPALGAADAPVTLVEFSDFECPYCRQFTETLGQVRRNYGNYVRLVYRQYPLDIHPHAPKAAEASLCAGDQDRFWELHDLMFAEQDRLEVSDLVDKARRLGLDAETFERCLASGQHAARVLQDVRAGNAAGVDGTPAIFINGRPLSGAVGYDIVKRIIDDELRRAGR